MHKINFQLSCFSILAQTKSVLKLTLASLAIVGAFNTPVAFAKGNTVDTTPDAGVDAFTAATLLHIQQQNGPFPHSISGIVELGSTLHRDNYASRASQAFQSITSHILLPEQLVDTTEACDTLDDRESCYKLGLHHLGIVLEQRADIQRNVEYSIKYLDKACRLQLPNSCVQLGLAYGSFGTFFAHGEFVSQDLYRAYEYFRQGCRLNDPYSCAQLGMMEYTGALGKVDRKQANNLLTLSCQLAQDAPKELTKVDPNYGIGCFKLGILEQAEYKKTNPAKANGNIFTDKELREHGLNNIQLACKLKYGRACMYLAVSAFNDPATRGQSHNYYEKACYAGIGDACVIAATIDNNVQNYTQATKIVKFGCSIYHADSCALYSSNLVEGVGVKKDVKSGFTYAVRSCLANSPLGCFYTANLFRKGVQDKTGIIMANKNKAIEYYKRACDLDHSLSCAEARRLQ